MATSRERRIEMSQGKDTTLVSGSPVDAADQIRLVNGRTMVGLRFVSTLAGKAMDWDRPTRTAAIRGKWSPENEKAVLEVFDSMLAYEAENDGEGMASPLVSGSPLLADWDVANWERVHTRTAIEDIAIESITGTEAVARVKVETVKLGGAFFVENRTEALYTL